MTHRIMCIDMDAFYVSCEQAFKPYLKKKPLAVGGTHERGVVCTCSYEARKYGVSSGMSSAAAKNLCPDIVFRRSDVLLHKLCIRRSLPDRIRSLEWQ